MKSSQEYLNNVPFDIREKWERLARLSFTELQRQIEGVENRLNPLISSFILNLMFSRRSHGLDFPTYMKEKKIVILSLQGMESSSFLPEQTKLIGVFAMMEIMKAGFARERDSHKPPFYLVADEIGSMPTNQLGKLLDQIAKCNIFSILAHQHTDQVKFGDDQSLYNSINTNAQNKIIFSLSGKDAKEMAIEMPELVDFTEPKFVQEKIAYRIVEKNIPEEQIVKATSMDWKMELSNSIRESVSQSNEFAMSHQQIQSIQEQQSSAMGQARQITETLTNSVGKTDICSLSNGLANIRSRSKILSETKSLAQQIAQILSNVKTNTDTSSATESLAKIISDSESSSTIHSEGKLIADILTQIDSKSDSESIATQINDMIANSETKNETEATENRETDTKTHASEDSYGNRFVRSKRKGERNSEVASTEETNRKSQGSESVLSSAMRQIASKGVHSQPGAVSQDSSFHSGNIREQSSSTRFSNETLKDQTTRNGRSTDRYQETGESDESFSGNRKIDSYSNQVSSSVLNSIINGIAQVKSHAQSEIKNNATTHSIAEQSSNQQTSSLSDVVNNATTHIIAEHQSDISSRISSAAMANIEAQSNTESINNIMSEAVSSMQSTQESQAVAMMASQAVSQIKALQSSGSLSFVEQTAIGMIKTHAETITHRQSTNISTDLGQTKNEGKAMGQKVTRIVTSKLVERHEEYIDRTPIFYTLEDQKHRIVTAIKNAPPRHCFVKKGTEPAVFVRVDDIPDVPWLGEYSEKRIAEFKKRVIESHPETYVRLESQMSASNQEAELSLPEPEEDDYFT